MGDLNFFILFQPKTHVMRIGSLANQQGNVSLNYGHVTMTQIVRMAVMKCHVIMERVLPISSSAVMVDASPSLLYVMVIMIVEICPMNRNVRRNLADRAL